MSRGEKISARRPEQIVEQCIRREIPGGTQPLAPEEDLVESGAVDSMAWVSVIRCIEAASGDSDFGERMLDQPRSIQAMVAALEHSDSMGAAGERAGSPAASGVRGTAATVAGWGAAIGTQRVSAAELEREFALKPGKIAKGAGIESVARAAEGEDEVTLAMQAAESALAAASAGIGDVDCVIATSETHVAYPSLGARLHAQLLADDRTSVLDIGGACLGVINALAVAQQFIGSGRFGTVLIATADVHSRMLNAARVKGEFGALFGDGASAFVLRGAEGAHGDRYCVGDVTLGCDASAAAAIRIGLNEHNGLDLVFDGESLARAAVGKLEQLITDLELRTGIRISSAAGFATHQPNPRLVGVLAKQLGAPMEKFPPVARRYGNLGSSTCGVALAQALASAGAAGRTAGPIFVASLGPGLLFGGTVLS
ncbi:MAG: 3-oxoacyl-ACP synthase III family protein [Candidatus Acidiferrales bacterium]